MSTLPRSLAFLLLAGCAGAQARPAPPPAASPSDPDLPTREQFQALQVRYLERGRVPAPQVSFAPQTVRDDGLAITVTPVLPESEPWNAWPDGTARLFTDAMGFLWRIELTADRPVRWSPIHTELAVNDTEQTFTAVPRADDVLDYLLQGAALETRLGATPNWSLRARSAGDFREAYLGTDARAGDRVGVVLFPAPTARIQTLAMQLTVGVIVEGDGVHQYHFLFE